MDLSKTKRIWMITDTHFGVRNSAVEWMDIIRDYFQNFFIPMLKKEKKDGDILVHLGDVFDSRQSLNLMVMNEGISVFEEISRIMPVVIIVGNHDIYKKNSNEVNSVKILKWIPNIKICEEPEVINASGKKLLMMPWRANREEEVKCITTHDADFLFCHTDVQGLKFNRGTEIQEGITFDDIKNFRKVYSGHIHYSQNKGNFRMLGCPYPLSRSDINNDKGVWLFDLITEKEHFFANNFSPKFVRAVLDKVLEMEEDDAKMLFKNNFVDVIVDQKWTLNFPFSAFYDEVTGYRKLEFVNKFSDVEEDDDLMGDENSRTEKIDIVELSKVMIDKTSHSDQIKEKLLNTIKTLHDKVQNKKEEENE